MRLGEVKKVTNVLVKLFNAVASSLRKRVVTVVFMGRLNIDEDIQEVFEKVIPIFQKPDSLEKVVLDLTAVDFIYPSTLLLFLGLREILIEKNVSFEITLVEGSKIHEYLLYCGFGDYFQLPAFPETVSRTMNGEKDVYKLELIDQLGDTFRRGENLVDMLKIRQPLSPQVEADIIDSVDEMLNNIAQHSGYSKCIILGQSYPSSKRIRFALYDNGMGIKSHITRLNYSDCHPVFKRLVTENMYLKMKHEAANVAIEQAARYSVSGTNYTRNSGAGLDFLIKFSIPTTGTVSIISEDGMVKWKAGQMVESKVLPFPVRGTLVSATINCDADSLIAYDREVLGGSI